MITQGWWGWGGFVWSQITQQQHTITTTVPGPTQTTHDNQRDTHNNECAIFQNPKTRNAQDTANTTNVQQFQHPR